MDGSRDLELVRHYKKKYCPSKKWCLFQDCCIYFSDTFPIMNMDHKAISDLTLRRMKLDAIWHGGEVSDDLSCATHLIVYSTPSSVRPFDILYDRCPSAKKHLLHDQRMHVVTHQWLEDSLCKNQRLPEDAYNLRPDFLVDLKFEPCAPDPEIPPAVEHVKEQRLETSAEKSRKRGRPVKANTKKKRQVARPAPRTRARTGRRIPAKIHLDESEDGASSDENNRTSNADSSASRGVQEHESTKEEGGGRVLGHSGHLHETSSIKGKRIQDDKDEGYPTTTKDTESSAKASTLDETNFQRSDYMEQGRKGAAEKLDIMYDPVQAMLLDMIPSLSQKEVGTGRVILEDKRESEPKAAVKDEQKPEIGTSSTVKKKVSYKDVASQLLGEF